MATATLELLLANSAVKTGILPPAQWKAITTPDLLRTTVETEIFPPVLRMVMATPDLLRANSAGKTGILPPVLWKAITMPDLPRTNNASQ